MNSIQYEELCRFFLADKLGISTGQVRSGTMLGQTRPDLPECKHQIDLYWEDENELILDLNITNAKWRSSAKVDQGAVSLLQQVKEELSANKAMMITNTGFTKGAKDVAENKRIALHIVRPSFDYAELDLKNRETIQTQLQEFSTNGKLDYVHETVHKAFELGMDTPVQASVSAKKGVHSKGIVRSHSNRMTQSPPNRTVPSYTQKTSGGQGQAQKGFARNTGGRANRGR